MRKGNILRKRNGLTLHRHKAVSNILAWAQVSDGTGAGFYPAALDICEKMADETGTPVHIVAGIVAALSPQTAWDENIISARELLSGKRPKMQTGARIAKAEAIWDGVSLSAQDVARILNGPKITAFYWNILGDEDAVTVDSHAVTVALCRPHELKRDSGNFWPSLGAPPVAAQYRFLAGCYATAAKKIGCTPSELQARTWATIRTYKGHSSHEIEVSAPF